MEMEILGVGGQILHGLLPNIEFRIQRQHVLERRAAVLADIAERKVAAIHPQYDERSGDTEDGGRLGGA